MRKKIITSIAGITFKNPDGTNRQDIARELRPGYPIVLIREPDNRFDPNAVMVLQLVGLKDWPQIGYLPREIAAAVAPCLCGIHLEDIGVVHSVNGGSGGPIGVKIEFEIEEDDDEDII